MKSWKTSLCGVLGALFVGLSQITEMPALWIKVFALLAATLPNIGLMFSRDNGVSSEQIRAGHVDKRQIPLFLFLLSIGLILGTGCAAERSTHRNTAGQVVRTDWRAGAVTPPPDASVNISASSIGLNVAQNPATQLYEFVLGWKRGNYTRLSPVATNQYIPTVKSSLKLKQGGLTTDVEESFETMDRVSGKVCEVTGPHFPRVRYAALKRGFDRGRLFPRHRPYLWTHTQIRMILPELIGTDGASAVLAVRCLRDRFSGDIDSPEWCVLNRKGWPVAPRAEFLLPSVNLLSADAPEVILRPETREGFDILRVWAVSGNWDIEVRTAGDEISIWQFVRSLSPGGVAVFLSEPDFYPREFRAVPK